VKMPSVEFRILYLLCAMMAFVGGYGASVLANQDPLQIFIAVWVAIFTVILATLLYRELKFAEEEPFRARELALLIISFHIFLLGGIALGSGWSSLWALDSKQLHVPGIQKTMAFFRGETSLVMESVFGAQVQLTYLWTALWFTAFGESPVVSALAMLAVRIATWVIAYDIARTFFGDRIARVALLLMAFTPTQIFYAMLLMKDPVVQMLTLLSFWSALRLYQYGHPRYLLIGLASIACLALERFYIVPTFAVSFALAAVLSPVEKYRALRVGFFCVSLLAVAGLFWMLFKRDFNIKILRENLEWVRAGFQGGAEVDKAWNMEISYPLAFVKILFTPFFRTNKFTFFTDLSALLTWGSFVSQAVIALSLWGIFSEFKRHAVRTLIATLPIFFFLLVFAYLAPFSGRQRDGYFPIFAVFAAYALVRIFRKDEKGIV
jgi:4-amino-4-deoxy-L-arabinose transferase-like glycosyltransferase